MDNMEYENNDFFEEDPDQIPQEEPEKIPGKSDGGKRFKSGQTTGYRHTKERIAYARALLNGKSQRQAFMEAFPNKVKTYKMSSIDTEASAIFNDKNFQDEIYQPEAIKMEQELEKQYRWSRGKAVRMLATSAELLYSKVQSEVEKEPDKRNTKELLGEMRTMKELIAELNQMHGLNKQNINVDGGVVVLSGEDDLED